MLVVGSLFETLIVPSVTEVRNNGRDVGLLVGAIITRSTIILSVILIPLVLAVSPLLMMTTGTTSESAHHVRGLLLEMAPIVLLTTWTSAIHGALNACKAFSVSALSPFLRSVIVVVAILAAAPRWGIHAVTLGYTVGESLRCLAAWYFFERRIGRLRLTWNMDAEVGLFFSSATFQTLGTGFHHLMPLVNQIMASPLAPGSISIYTYVLRLRSIPYLLFSTGVASVVFSHWADQHSQSRASLSWSRTSGLLLRTFILASVGVACLLPLCPFIATLALGWGAFSAERLSMVSALLRLLLVSLPFDFVGLLCVRLVLILRGNVFFMCSTACRVMVLVVLNSLLIPRYGLMGIGVATVVVNILFCLAIASYARLLCEGAPPRDDNRGRDLQPHATPLLASVK